MKKSFDESQSVDICFRYRFGADLQELADDFKVARSTVWLELQRNGVRCRKTPGRVPVYECNRNFFHSMEEEAPAYWLGFIAADGCVRSRINTLCVGLAEKDMGHLFRLKSDMESSHPVHHEKARSRCYFQVASVEVVRDLDRWGVRDRKTYDLKWPDLNPKAMRHFSRGYVDGDGCFWKGKEAWRANFSVVGNFEFLRSMQDYMASQCHLSHTKLQPGQGPSPLIGRLEWGGSNQVLRIARFLYDDATVFLGRKKSVMLL